MSQLFGLARPTSQHLESSQRYRRTKLLSFFVPSARHPGICRKTIDLELLEHVRIVGRSQRKCCLDVVRVGSSFEHKACRGKIAGGNEIFPALEKNRNLLPIKLARYRDR